jgi:hypothetical protein
MNVSYSFQLHSLARSAFGAKSEPKQTYARPERTLPRPLHISDCILLPDFSGSNASASILP